MVAPGAQQDLFDTTYDGRIDDQIQRLSKALGFDDEIDVSAGEIYLRAPDDEITDRLKKLILQLKTKDEK